MFLFYFVNSYSINTFLIKVEMKHLSRIHFTVFLLILTSLVMNYVYYANTGNFNSPIIEYEFVKSQSDVKNIFTDNNEFKKDVIQGVHDQNIVDYVYMIAYSLFLTFVFAKLLKFEKKNIYIFGIILVIFALITDSIENILLFNISELLTARNNFNTEIHLLMIITNIKWISIAISLFILSFHYYKNNTLGKFFAFISTLPLILGILHLITQNEILTKYFTSSIILGFVILMVWVFIPPSKNKAINFYK